MSLVARMLLLAALSPHATGFFDLRNAADVLQAVQPALFNGASATQLAQQLSQLQGELAHPNSGDSHAAESSGSIGVEPPTLEELQVVWCHVAHLVIHSSHSKKLPHHQMASLVQKAADRLLQLQPDNPRSSFQAGMVCTVYPTASCCFGFIPACLAADHVSICRLS